ncbi:MAG: glutamate synthase [Oscillospiraceae bacterium]|jgi:glutamate synthase domain-containing protein 3|nr:glutamate synthase [Oscillospiraceae bacterium]
MSATLSAIELGYQPLNDAVREAKGDIVINNAFGERFIAASATGDKNIVINGTPGNALGCYLDGAKVTVNGNAQDAVGDTMNDGEIVVHGRAGDALGYAMRGGVIYVKGDSGYRTGIHMKQYRDKRPVIVVGGRTGSFLGEYMAGGLLIVLGLYSSGLPPVGRYTGTGMHGGRIFLRCETPPDDLPAQVVCERATDEDVVSVSEYIKTFARLFGANLEELLGSTYFVLTPNASNPYRQLYTAN